MATPVTRHLRRGGWLPVATQVPSPNCDVRPDGVAVDLLVIHSISLPPGCFGGGEVVDFFLNRLDVRGHPYFEGIAGLRVSSHFFLPRTGGVVQFVSCDMRAWHAGVSSWRGRDRCNDFSIGVELEGTDTEPFAVAQYEALVRLTLALRHIYPISDIVGHSDVAPGRKTDPGPCFDWTAYRQGVGA
ncbi:MAG: 1,6-anhydro-N-acetylmuramyl-L-alanine amidase AmpD [Betaproteobacteria bacterium]|nr:1,6-anhydro-N-acetylmuramyl-L-alanine amidase AmpD [Betaproteobacteria bacterium]